MAPITSGMILLALTFYALGGATTLVVLERRKSLHPPADEEARWPSIDEMAQYPADTAWKHQGARWVPTFESTMSVQKFGQLTVESAARLVVELARKHPQSTTVLMKAWEMQDAQVEEFLVKLVHELDGLGVDRHEKPPPPRDPGVSRGY